MSAHSIFCIATSHFQANHIVDQLKIAKIPDEKISALLADQGARGDFFGTRKSMVVEGAIAGGSTGAVIGVAWGWIAGIGALAIPGAGIFITAGPIVAAMSGATIGATLGGICGGLIGLGIPEIEAKRYEGKILKGDILLSVHTEVPKDILKVKKVFGNAEAVDIWAIAEGAPAASFRQDSPTFL